MRTRAERVTDAFRRDSIALRVQRAASLAAAPLLLPLIAGIMRFGRRWRLAEVDAVRARYRELRASAPGPLLICANHLTLVDSALIATAFASPLWYLGHFAEVPWNMPERSVFATSPWKRTLAYLLKCLPVERGRDRRAVAAVLDRAAWLLAQGESVLVFPEGGRSRTDGVDTDAQTYGVGRLLRGVPGCRVLCVHLRGESQRAMSDYPVRGETFHVALRLLEPKTDQPGLRGAVDLSRQVLHELAAMERESGRCSEGT